MVCEAIFEEGMKMAEEFLLLQYLRIIQIFKAGDSANGGQKVR
jgi:hypothetical protein